MIFVVDIEDNFGPIQFLDGHIIEGEVEGLLPDGIIGQFAHLSNLSLTGVFLVCPRISISTKASHADLSKVVM
jgi:hypothetical protein